jgi:hypothetical protein
LGCFYPRSPIAHGWLFHPCAIDDPRGRFFVRAGFAKTCALRAPTVFSLQIKNIRRENTVMNKSKDDIGLLLSKIATLQQ